MTSATAYIRAGVVRGLSARSRDAMDSTCDSLLLERFENADAMSLINLCVKPE